MFKSFRKSFIAVSVGLVIATSIMPSRMCSISALCPVREARAEGIMDNPMMLMMLIMLLSQMMGKGKQADRTAQGTGNLYQAGQGGQGSNTNPSNPFNPTNPLNPNNPGNPNNGGTLPVNPGNPNVVPNPVNPNPFDPTNPLNFLPRF